MTRPFPAVHDIEPPPLPLRVVGDVHLREQEPEVADRFLAWLSGCAGTDGSIVLLGDVFETWVGRPQQADPLPQRVRTVLARVAAGGTRLYFMRGNRDPLFDGMDGVPIECFGADPVRFHAGGRSVVMTHGDQLCTADHGYLALRRFFYGPGGRLLNAALTFRLKRRLAAGLRGVSRKETRKKVSHTMGLDYGEALRWMHHYEAEVLVAGHVHTGVHHRHAGTPPREILVLKDWQRGGSVIQFDGEHWALQPLH